MITIAEAEEPVLWQTYVSWNQFAWLYMVSLFAALRGALLWQAAIPGLEMWVIGAVALVVGCDAGVALLGAACGDVTAIADQERVHRARDSGDGD